MQLLLLLLLLLLASTSSPPPPPFPPTTTTYWYLPSSTHNYTSKPQPPLLCNHNYEESHRVRLGGILSKWLPWHDDTWPLCLPDAEWNWDADQVSFKWPLPVTPRPTIRRLVCRHKKGMMRRMKIPYQVQVVYFTWRCNRGRIVWSWEHWESHIFLFPYKLRLP